MHESKNQAKYRKPLNALATPRPRQPDKIMPDGARQKIAGSIWFPGPKIGRKIEGSWPD